MSDRLNLQNPIQALTYLDNCISGQDPKISSDSGYGQIIEDLCNGLYDKRIVDDSTESNMKYHEYLFQTFKAFTQFKKQIEMRLDSLVSSVQDKVLLKLLLTNIDEEEWTTWNSMVGNKKYSDMVQ